MTASVATVVVTYNRKQLLLECLAALVSQTRPLDGIIIVDNASTDGTPDLLRGKGYLDGGRIDYLRLPKNTGSSGGFHEGVKRGYEAGYDWLWLMDDDAEPKAEALEKLSEYFNRYNISALSGVVKDTKGIPVLGHRGLFDFRNVFPIIKKPVPKEYYNEKILEIDMASFVGILVNREAIDKIGYPRREFFICHDDVEYCTRLRKVGKILLITDSIIFDKNAGKNRRIQKRFLGRTSSRFLYDRLWFAYYRERNAVWLGKIHAENQFLFYRGVLKSYCRSFFGIILYDNYKLKRIYILTLSYRDGLTGNFSRPIQLS